MKSNKIHAPDSRFAKVGLDTVIEAIRFYRERRKIKVDDLMRYATVCRVNKIMRPYLEAIL